jgi:hypothetical protein
MVIAFRRNARGRRRRFLSARRQELPSVLWQNPAL